MTLKSQCKAKGGTFKKDTEDTSKYVCEIDNCKLKSKELVICRFPRNRQIQQRFYGPSFENCKKSYRWDPPKKNGFCNRYLNDGSGFGSWTSKIQ